MLRVLFCVALTFLAAASACADTPMVAQPLAPSARSQSGAASVYKPEAKLRLPAPTINVTRMVRQADGSLKMQCDQQPNPRAKIALPNRPVSPHAQVQQ